MTRIQTILGWPVVALVLVSISAWAPTTMARDLDFCSTLNTGGSANMSIYQTVGLCYDFCIGEYAYAVVNYQSCWCTNWEPAESTEVDMDECNTNCPGYPDEKCGGARNRFGYVALGMNPSGTSTPPSHSTKTGESSKTTAAPSPTTATTTDDGGLVRTVTTTPASSTDLANNQDADSDSSGLNTGQVVGIVVGVIGGMAAVAVAVVCFVVARRKKQSAATQEKGKGRSDMGESSFAAVFSPSSGGWRQSGPSAGSRLSQVDPRMDPFKPGLYARNSSQESFHTMRDEQDYSRPVHQPKVLRATNPDPEDD